MWTGSRMPARGAARVDAEQARSLDLTSNTITAMLLGLDSRVATFAVQRDINRFTGAADGGIARGPPCRNCGACSGWRNRRCSSSRYSSC